MSADNSNQGPRDDDKVKKTSAKRRGAEPDDVGKALRSAYDEALQEEVPDDFLDLLGKLS